MTERLSLSSVFSSEWPNTSYKPSSPFPCTLVLEGRGRGPEDWCSVSRDLPNPVFSPASHPGPPSTPQSPRSWCSQVHSPRVNLLSCLAEGAHLAAQGGVSGLPATFPALNQFLAQTCPTPTSLLSVSKPWVFEVVLQDEFWFFSLHWF